MSVSRRRCTRPFLERARRATQSPSRSSSRESHSVSYEHTTYFPFAVARPFAALASPAA